MVLIAIGMPMVALAADTVLITNEVSSSASTGGNSSRDGAAGTEGEDGADGRDGAASGTIVIGDESAHAEVYTNTGADEEVVETTVTGEGEVTIMTETGTTSTSTAASSTASTSTINWSLQTASIIQALTNLQSWLTNYVARIF